MGRQTVSTRGQTLSTRLAGPVEGGQGEQSGVGRTGPGFWRAQFYFSCHPVWSDKTCATPDKTCPTPKQNLCRWWAWRVGKESKWAGYAQSLSVGIAHGSFQRLV